MSFDSCSFEIGENTLMELEMKGNLMIKTPLSTKQQKHPDEQDSEVEESPNAKENVSLYSHLSLQERLNNATQRLRNKSRFEKTKSSSAIENTTKTIGTRELSSICKYLQVEEINLSAWERSAAKLMSPALHAPKTTENLTDHKSLPFDFTESQLELEGSPCVPSNVGSEKLLEMTDFEDEMTSEKDELDQAISGDISLNSTASAEDIDCSVYDMENVTFMQPRETNADVREKIEEHINQELKQQHMSMMKSSETFQNDSIINTSHNISIREHHQDLSLTMNPSKNLRLLCNWNLPSSVVNEYRKKNMTEMFEWQTECLRNPKVLFDGSNLVYSAPTSAGKTLVSEILMIKNIVERRKKALFILPFVSVVREKMFYLQDIMASSGLRVEGFFGGYHPPGGFESIDLAVCTIEKANSIVNRLLEQDKLSDIGMIIIDEVHLISDSSRGYILELLLTKILYMCEKYKHKIQIVTMSATLPNVELLQKWLKAEFFFTDFRPIELREMIKIDKKIYDQKMNLVRVIDEKWNEFFPNDTDEVCTLAMETIMDNCQLIIFCPSKDWCEQIATNLARGVYNMMKSVASGIHDVINRKRVENLLEQVKSLPSGVDQVLARSLGYGCAFHHAGLTTDERDLIEMGFKDGTLKVLCATSTLSSGVNLPARRVVIRTPMFGKNMMSNLTYRQMIGRAGRKGKDTLGESILVCNEATSRVGKQLVVTPLDPISSCLDVDNNAHLKRALLEIIASGVANTKADLENFVNSTLFCQQHDINFSYFRSSDDDLKKQLENKSEKKVSDINEEVSETDPIKSSMDFLLEYEFIRLHIDGETSAVQFVPTRLGLACLSSSLPPKDGFMLFSELQKSRQNFVLESELHAIYLVTPFSVAYQLHDIDWVYFAEIHDRLPEVMKRVGALVGVSDTYLIKAITGKQGSDWRAQQIHKRFYTALALQELVNEKSITEVSTKYKIHRGLLQSLQQMASTFAGTVTAFCKSLQWNLLALILAQFRERLFFGIHPDLIELMKIPSMSSTRIARALYKNGIEKMSDLANSKTLSIENILMDLGGNFFVIGKTVEMNVQELAKMLVSDARNHIQNEMGLKAANWTQIDKEPVVQVTIEQETIRIDKPDEATIVDKVPENVKGNMRKRKCEALLTTPTLQPTDEVDVPTLVKKKKVESNSSNSYRRKLRSSGGPDNLVNINTQFMNDLDRKAEKSAMEKSDENASMFKSHVFDTSHVSANETTALFEQHLTIIDVLASEKSFEIFMKEISEHTEGGMSVGVQKFHVHTQMIGGNILKSGVQNETNYQFIFDDALYVDCISFCFNANRVCYLNLQNKDQTLMRSVKHFLASLMERNDFTFNTYEAREHLKVLAKAFGFENNISAKVSDPRLGSWLLEPDTNYTWQEMLEKFSPENLNILELASKHSTTSVRSFALNHASRVESKVRTAVESFLSNAVIKQQLEIMKITGKGLLSRVFGDLEMSIQVVLMKMELSGFPINEKKLQETIEEATLLQRQLEQHIYELNGGKFNLSSSKEVSKVVGIHRNLEKKKVSTAKSVLEKLDLPVATLIMTWRTLSKTVSNMQPMMKIVKKGRIYANSFSLTQTGRISMYEPNLQNVTKDFDVEFKSSKGETVKSTLSFRSVFQSSPGKVLLSADFCQLELRILTHLCKDPSLLKVMNSPGEDIFKKIAAKWNKVDETTVKSVQRNQTKQLCYGIIYGMGTKSLADTMKVDEETAAKLAQEFHSAYPQLKTYADKLVQKAREQGFIETLTGRRRYLPAIRSDNSSERSQAERQTLNSCVQGSASDLVKNAMLRMDRNVRRQQLEGCELVLHLHDELFYEVSEKRLRDAAKVLIHSMQNCVKLAVPLLVKLKTGVNWGEMKDFDYKT